MRLAKYLAHAGVASRRAAETLIGEGRVAVDGAVASDPARDVSEACEVAVDGRLLGGTELRVHFAINKPVGVVSTARDTHGRPTVMELVPEQGLRLYPVGRLDADTSGLILLTNDGELTSRLTHPRFEVPKTYRARVGGGRVGEDALRALRHGVQLQDGPTAPARVRRVPAEPSGRAPGPNRPGPPGRGAASRRGTAAEQVIELTIHEGRNRQVRRMCEAVGHPVLALERIAFGPLRLGALGSGEHRLLSLAEVERLRAAAAEAVGERA
jgi:23S rRNA pseudouridine2605 synthase